MSIVKNYRQIFKKFYSNNISKNENIDNYKLEELIEKSKNLNELYNNKLFLKSKIERYIKIMERIETSNGYTFSNSIYPNTISTKTYLEKYLLFMFSIDPDFEATIIYGCSNTTKEIKEKMISKFGIYDPYLIKIEKYYINKFLSKEKRDEINDKIEEKVFN